MNEADLKEFVRKNNIKHAIVIFQDNDDRAKLHLFSTKKEHTCDFAALLANSLQISPELQAVVEHMLEHHIQAQMIKFNRTVSKIKSSEIKKPN